jgi:hypothetical protein
MRIDRALSKARRQNTRQQNEVETSMTATQLNKSEWQAYFERVSKALIGKQAEIEVNSLPVSEQLEEEWLPLRGISYDPQRDIVEVVLEGLDHVIHKPRTVSIEHNGAGLRSMEVIDGDEAMQTVRFRDPLMLPPP